MTSVPRTCTQPDCSRPYEARGFCQLHYRRSRDAGLLTPRILQTSEQRKAKAAARDAAYYRANKDKTQKYRAEHYRRNKEKRLIQVREWAKNNSDLVKSYGHSRRVLIRGGITDRHTLADVLALYGTDCHLCHEPIDMTAPRKCGVAGWEFGLHKDHVIPVAKGGHNTLENVRPAHGICNLKKWANI